MPGTHDLMMAACRQSQPQGKERTNSHPHVIERQWGRQDFPGALRTMDLPLIHFASGSWILKSSLKRSSTVTFFFCDRLVSSAGGKKRQRWLNTEEVNMCLKAGKDVKRKDALPDQNSMVPYRQVGCWEFKDPRNIP